MTVNFCQEILQLVDAVIERFVEEIVLVVLLT